MQLSAGTREMVERARRTGERVDWDPYIQMMDELRIAAGSADGLASMMESNLEAQPELARLAAVFVSPRQLYRFLVGTFATAAFSHMTSSVEDLGRGQILVRTVLPPAYRDGTSFFECCVGGLRCMPRYMGLPAAELAAEITPHQGLYRLRLPASRTLAARIAPAMRTALEQLSLYAAELQQLTDIGATKANGSGSALEGAIIRFAFTPRQRDVATLLIRGASNKEIAAELRCAERTVELHVSMMMRKTQTANRTQLAAVLLST